VCLAITALSSTDARAGESKAPDYFHHQVWSTEEGLPQASAHALLQSHDGYLWIATEDGAARFDGLGFRVLNHATVPAFVSDDVSCLAEDQAGQIWFGTSDGLVRKRGGEYRRFSQRDGLPSDEIVALAAGPNDLLVLTTGGLAVRQYDHFERVRSNEEITGLAGTEQGMFLVSKRGGVYRWNKGQLIAMVAPREDGTAVLGVATSDGQAIWTFGTNFVQFSSPAEKKIWKSGLDLPGNRVQALYVDPQGKAWIGTNRGLVSLDPAASFAVRDSEALAGESILSIYVDREGDLWIGTEASGLHALQPRKFATVPGSNSEAVTTVASDNRGVMYFGTRDDGIFRVQGDVVQVTPNKLTSPVILSLAAGPDGDLWAGTPDGINHIVGAKVRHWTIADGLPDNFIRSVLVDADGSLWAGTRFGLVHIGGKDVQTFTRADGLVSESIGPLLGVKSKQGGSVLWIGTSAGLCRQTNREFRCLVSPFQASGSIVTALAADRDGALWVALHGHGLGIVKDDRIVPIPVSAVPLEIVGILADKLGYLWLRSTRGLYRVQISDLRACVTNPSVCGSLTVNAYGRGDGMQSDELAGEGIPGAGEGPNGELWFATRRGMAITDPQHLLTNRVPPGVVITQVHVDGLELPADAPAEIRPGHRQYSFEYAGLSLNNTVGTHCRYMLDGFDRGWVDAGTRRTAYYTNLSPRQYNFRVLCANSDGVWSRDEASFHFRVLRPWYRSSWIYLLGVCLAALGMFGFVQLRVRAERRRFDLVLQERTRVAREVHDTLAQDLVSVSLQVEMAAQHAKAGRLADVSQQLTQTRSLVRQALESARQSIWNLRANLPEDSLPVRLTARVETFRGTNMTARLRISGEYRKAAASIEDEVMRIAAEAISNVERHSGATEMTIDLSYGAESVKLQVRDNGCGFDYASARGKADRYGLKGLEERAALLQARLSVETIVGQGTTVTLITPLPERSS
jgi:signal transduction histidine kinase/ligand-binding sensor domain-containing protein